MAAATKCGERIHRFVVSIGESNRAKKLINTAEGRIEESNRARKAANFRVIDSTSVTEKIPNSEFPLALKRFLRNPKFRN